MTAIVSSYWHKMESGHYAKQVGSVRFDVEYWADTKLWYCRRNGEVFDAAKTLREAKQFCIEHVAG